MEFFEKSAEVEFQYEELDSGAGEIHRLAVARSRRYRLAEADLLESIAEIDRFRIYEAFHYTHLTPYCVKELGLSEEVAACFIRVARKGREVPQLQEAVQVGKISVTKAKTIAAVITPENQEAWIGKAAGLSKRELEAEVAEADPRAGKPERARPVGEQKIRVEFELTREEMERFRRAQELCGAGSLAETQQKLLKYFLDRKDPVRKADRARERTHRSQERSPAAEIHAVHRRDRGRCQAKLPDGTICGSKKWIQLHHKIARSEDGDDTAKNLITLCSAHHRQWHSLREGSKG